MKTFRNRKRQRGAAMVEAAIVIPTMLVFLGLIMWVNKSYETKLDRQTATRASVLYYASKACDSKETPESITKGLETNTGASKEDASPAMPDGVDTGRADQQAGKVGGSQQAGISRDMQMVHAKPGDVSVTGTAITPLEATSSKSLSISIHAEAEVACNEKVYGGFWSGLIGMAKNMWQSGGGFGG
jgi:hypothetical protein